MDTIEARLESGDFTTADDVIEVPKARVETVQAGGQTFKRYTMEPGWRWSQHVKPIVGTDSCQVLHICYQIQGTMHTVLDDGSELEAHAGEVYVVPPGHDGWVVGDEPNIVITFEP
jgi:quercetin dioxygenase-like cupin family protein